jgi:hypothetical protein
MRTLFPIALLFLPSLLLAQSPAAPSVREVALNLAVTMTAHQMATCAKAHPEHSERFTNSLNGVQNKLEMAIDGLRPQRTADLDLTVPEVLIVGQEMTANLIASDTSLRTLDVCNRTANEIANVTEREASELMNQLVTTIITGVTFHQREMDRVLR